MAERVPPIRSQSLLPVFLMLGTGCELLAGLTEDRRMRPPEDNLGGTRSDGGRGGSTAGADTGVRVGW
jgi:hypothetical protein